MDRESLWQKERRFAQYLKLEKIQKTWHSLDLMQIKATDADDKPTARLKVLGLRLCAPKVQSLPYAPGSMLTKEEDKLTGKYSGQTRG